MKLQELGTKVGQRLGTSDWHVISQTSIDEFARITLDDQWIHTDPARAASGPFGATIVHGLLTLSLCPRLLQECLTVEGIDMQINYGLDKVRFPSPVRAGTRVRGHAVLEAFETVPGAAHTVIRLTVDNETSEKPACVALMVARFVA